MKELINWNTTSWKLNQIQYLISVEDYQNIEIIPLGDESFGDKLIWPDLKNGQFSVKYGYHHIHSQNCTPSTQHAHSSHRVNTIVWKTIWSIDVPPKIMNFLWRILVNALPSYHNLHRRKITPSPLCPICDLFPESIEHLFLQCSGVVCAWFASELNYKVDLQSIDTFDKWCKNIICIMENRNASKEEFLTKIAFFLWEIWKARNAFVYEALPFNPILVARRTSLAAWEFLACKHHYVPLVDR